MSTVKEAKYIDRRFCFELISPEYGRRIYQVFSVIKLKSKAIGEEDMRSWIYVISKAIEAQLTGVLHKDDSLEDCINGMSVEHIFRNSDSANKRMLVSKDDSHRIRLCRLWGAKARMVKYQSGNTHMYRYVLKKILRSPRMFWCSSKPRNAYIKGMSTKLTVC